MPDTDGVLAAIDACLEDSLSDDAMRWAPDAATGPDVADADDLGEAGIRCLIEALRSPFSWSPPCCAGCVPYSGQPHSCEIATRRFWSSELGRWAVWPEGACPECGSGVIEGQDRWIHGEHEGPWKYRYSCGHRLYSPPVFADPDAPAVPEEETP